MKRLLSILLALALILAGCASPSDTDALSDSATDPTTESTEPIAPEEVTVNLFAELFPQDNNVPNKREFQDIAKTLTDGFKGRLTEVTYTWKDGRCSLEVLAGVEDVYKTTEAPEESPLELVYGESEFYNYVLYLPEGYDQNDTEKKWPVIYFFHGIGESGDDLNALLPYGVLKYLNSGGKLDAIVIAPQCPGDSHWADTNVEEEKLVQFVPEMAAKYNIDTDRMYLTGLSMGGRCTWKLALAMPDTFAAIVVVCGRTNTYEFDTIADMPIWMFHGACDGTVSFDNINRIVPTLLENDHRYFKLTVYPNLSHDVWTTTYAKPEIYDWLLSQSLSANQAAQK